MSLCPIIVWRTFGSIPDSAILVHPVCLKIWLEIWGSGTGSLCAFRAASVSSPLYRFTIQNLSTSLYKGRQACYTACIPRFCLMFTGCLPLSEYQSGRGFLSAPAVVRAFPDSDIWQRITAWQYVHLSHVDIFVYAPMIDRHFKTQYDNCDYNICHFMTEGIRYNRFSEACCWSAGSRLWTW